MTDFVNSSREIFNRQAHRLTNELAGRVDPLAQRLHAVGDRVRSNEAEPLADLVERGAASLDAVVRYLETADGERLIADAEARTRENPVLAAGIAFATGLLVCRYLRSSNSEGAT
jgi:hypothetical protein